MSRALCFDMYGTLCDTSSVTTRLGEVLDVPGVLVDAVDRTWRQKQLQYAYQTSMMGTYEPFWSVTDRALSYALDQHDLDPDEDERERILDAYNHLDPYPDATDALARLRDAGRTCVVLSNGNPEMLATLAANAGLDDHLADLVSADEVSVFKPDPRVYENAADRLDRSLDECRLVSANAWDVAGAGQAGMATGWVNRRRDPPEAVGADPDVQAASLSALADDLLS